MQANGKKEFISLYYSALAAVGILHDIGAVACEPHKKNTVLLMVSIKVGRRFGFSRRLDDEWKTLPTYWMMQLYLRVYFVGFPFLFMYNILSTKIGESKNFSSILKNIDRICFIIGNHHTDPSKIDGLDFQIQWEADCAGSGKFNGYG